MLEPRSLCNLVTHGGRTKRLGWDASKAAMKKWLRRIRGAIGMGLTWAAAWAGAGVALMLGLLLTTGSRPDVPIPLVFGVFGLLGGVGFSGVLSLLEGRRRFAQMSVPRFAGWGAAAGFLLSLAFVFAVATGGDAGFWWNLVGLGPIFAAAGAGSAAGSLVLARRADDPRLFEADDAVAQLRSPSGTEVSGSRPLDARPGRPEA